MCWHPLEGPDFVSVYLDDVIVFSRTLNDHLHHISLVIERLSQAGLKLKPCKCHFIAQEVQYLGHLLKPHKEFVQIPIGSQLCETTLHQDL